MRIYIAIIEDKHTDVKVSPFSTAEKAIQYAKDQALAGADGDWSEIEEEEIEGCLYAATYSCEGDYVTVVEKEIDALGEG